MLEIPRGEIPEPGRPPISNRGSSSSNLLVMRTNSGSTLSRENSPLNRHGSFGDTTTADIIKALLRDQNITSFEVFAYWVDTRRDFINDVIAEATPQEEAEYPEPELRKIISIHPNYLQRTQPLDQADTEPEENEEEEEEVLESSLLDASVKSDLSADSAGDLPDTFSRRKSVSWVRKKVWKSSSKDAKAYITEEQAEREAWRAWRAKFEPWWEQVFCFALVYNYVSVPFRIGFEVPASVGFIVFDIVLDTILVAAVALRFKIPDEKRHDGIDYLDDMVSQADVAKKYRSSYMIWIDVLCVLPLDFIGIGLYLAGIPQITQHRRISCIVLPEYRLVRMLLVARIEAVVTSTLTTLFSSVLDFNPIVWRICRSFVIFFFAIHGVACLYFNLLLFLGTERGFVQWAQSRDLENATLVLQYTTSFDFVTKNFVGMSRGAAFPDSDRAIMFLLGVAFLGVALYSTLLSTIGGLVTDQDSSELRRFEAKMDVVHDYLRYKALPVGYRNNVVEYYQHVFQSQNTLVTLHSEFLADLPGSLRRKMALHMGCSILEKVPIFKMATRNHDFVIQIVTKLKPVVFAPLTTVMLAGEVGDSMYFVLYGVLQVVTVDGRYIATLRQGDFFGEIAILIGCQRTATVHTSTYTNCMELRRDDFDDVASNFAECLESIRERANERLLAVYAVMTKQADMFILFMVHNPIFPIFTSLRYFRYWKAWLKIKQGMTMSLPSMCAHVMLSTYQDAERARRLRRSMLIPTPSEGRLLAPIEEDALELEDATNDTAKLPSPSKRVKKTTFVINYNDNDSITPTSPKSALSKAEQTVDFGTDGPSDQQTGKRLIFFPIGSMAQRENSAEDDDDDDESDSRKTNQRKLSFSKSF